MQVKRPWTIIGGATAAVAVGVAGIGLTNNDNGGDDLLGPISLKDRISVSETHTPDRPEFDIVPRPVLGADSNDSPFDGMGGVAGSNDSPSAAAWDNLAGTGDTADSFNTPNDAFDSTADSPAQFAPPPPPPVYDSFDSPNYVAPAPAAAPVFDSPNNSGGGSFDSADGS